MAVLDFLKNKDDGKRKRKPAAKKPKASSETPAVQLKRDAPSPALSGTKSLSLIAPIISEKGARLAEKSAYMFRIPSWANKIEVKKAVEGLYKVTVRKVNIVNIPRKRVRVRRVLGWRKAYKKAIVSLAKGQTIEQA